MAKSKSPAYQRYPRDILANPDIIALEYDEYGVLERLKDFTWLEESLPNDEQYLAKILKISPKKFRKVFSAIEKFFKIEDGKITCPELDEQRLKQAEWRLKSSAGGKETVRRRREKVKGGSEMVQRVVQPDVNSSTSSSISNTPPPPFETKNSNGNGVGKKNGLGEMGGSKFSEIERRQYAKAQSEIKDVDAYVNSLRSKRGDFDGRIGKWVADNCSNCRAYNSDRHSGSPCVPPCPKHGAENFADWKIKSITRRKKECRQCRKHDEYPDESPVCDKHGDDEILNRNFQSFVASNLKERGLNSADYFAVTDITTSAVGESEVELSIH